MKTQSVSRTTLATCLSVILLALPAMVLAAPPDLTAPGAITALKTDTAASPLYSLTYNLGPTGLRGWMYLRRGYGTTYGQDGTMTDEDRQILVTVASAPANTVLAVDDLILGVDWGFGTGAIPSFGSDARKAFGAAITEAEKAENGGILRIKRWRAGVTTDVSFTLPVMGTYSATAPYNCPKSAAILASARNKLVSQLQANPNFLTNDWKGAASALALLAGVAPGDPDYSTVQTRLQTYARALSTAGPVGGSLPIWNWGYLGVFLSEYYLATGDTAVLPGISQYSLKLAQSQSMFGTFGHGPAIVRPDGSGRMSVAGYGPVNSAGLPANLALVMARKALLAGAQTVDPQVDAAIQRASDFFSWYVNKGSIPYGEHHPGADDHASNGKDQAAALFFSQQDNRLAETEYFTRMCVAGFTGRECGHTGQGFSYLWEGMATSIGGQLAVSEYFKPVRWHLDLTRRTDGSFAYDGGEQYDAGKTSDGTYLGSSGYYDLNPTACYLLTYSLPLKRLYITGKNANPAHQLDSTKVANAIAAATYKFDRTSRSTTQLIGDLSEFDPVVRNFAAQELAIRTLSSGELTTLRTMLSGTNANGRMGACQTLGLRKDATAMTMITQRLDKTVETDPWVRATAANALRDYGTAANSQVNTMLARFKDNAADPDTIVWNDPLQASNGKLSWALFDSAPGTSYFDFGATAINAAKNLLYPAVSTGFKHPDSAARQAPANFAFSRMPIADVRAMPNDFINLILSETQCDRMWSSSGRRQGLRVLSKYKFFETMPLGLSVLDVPTGFEWGYAEYVDQAISEIATYGEAARWTLPTLRSHLNTWDPGSSTQTALVNAINSIEAATTSPAITYLKAAASGQVVTTGAGSAKAIDLTGSSVREPSVSFTVLTQPSNGTLTGTAPNLTYTPNPGYTGPDHFSFRTADTLTTSEPATVGIVVGSAGNGLKGEYFNNADFTAPVLTRTDAQINFDWGTGSPHASIGADTFSVRWSGLLLVPETCAYTFSALSSDGARLYIKGVPVIDNFVDQNSKWTDSAPIQLTKGQMLEIQMEYYENTGSAAAKLKWTGPSVAGLTGAIIPQAYLFDGSGITNRTPYAHAQTVFTVMNTSKSITLTGSGGTLTYAVLTQPANGDLTGTAPNLTYTPAANFSGTDSFTFLVNNGSGNSSPATVSISVAAGLPVTYTWASSVSANMSAGASWVGGTPPPAAGLAYCNLNFAPTGIYTATHDLNNGFKLNQLNFSGVVTIAGANTLSFSTNGGTLPTLNQNSANAVTVNPPLELAATTTFGGSYGGKITLGGLISGSGGLVKTSPGALQINNFNNTYTGGTILNNGTVTFPAGNGSATPHFGTGPITINPGATLSFNRTVLSNAITLNACTVSGGNSFSSVFSGPVTLNGITTVSLGTTGGLQISGNVSGTGGFTTTGTTQWTMNGSNSYTGPTTIQAGILRYQAVGAVAPGALIIATGGKANLNYTGNKVVASLTLGGIAMPAGSYGGSASSATFKNDGYFTSTSVGTITVLPPTTTSLALTGGSNPSTPGSPLTFTATVSGSSPTGSVAFYDGTTLLGTGTLNGSFQAGFTTSTLAVGSHSITAKYAGNATNGTSTSTAVAVEIISLVPPAPTNLLASAGSNHVGLTWTLSTGATSYYVKRSLASGGPYTVIGNPDTGNYDDLTAVNGNTYYYVVSAINSAGESGNSNQVTGIPVIVPSTTTLVSSPVATGPYGTLVTFTATVSASGGPPTGTVTFKDGATVLGTGTLSSGTATFATSTLAVANHSITATFGGDATFGSSVSAPAAHEVTAKPLTITGVTANDKIYDGNATAILTGGAISGGLVGGETVNLIPGIGTFASPNAGIRAVTATGFAIGGANAGNYTLSAQPIVPNATITRRPVHLTGTRTYDATALASAADLTIQNRVGGDDLLLTGAAMLADKDVGTRSLLPPPARVQSATGSTGSSASTTCNVNLTTSPLAGNTLVAVISTRGTSANRVSAVSGGGVTWSRASQGTNTGGSTTEIWVGPNVSSGTTGIAITQASLISAAVVIEYSGILSSSPLDQIASASATSNAALTGTTPATTQASELWIGGIGIRDGRRTLNAPYGNAFTVVALPKSGSASGDAMIYALEKIVSTTGAASSGGTLSASDTWSGAIATFKAASNDTLALSGAAASNYTLTGRTGSFQITPKTLTLTATPAVTTKPYDGLTAATLTGATLQVAQTPGTGGTSDGTPYIGDEVAVILSGLFDTKDADSDKVVTSTSSLGGAQMDNYTLSQPVGLTGTITPAGLTITADDQSKTYGQTLAFGSGATQFTSSGLQDGETIGSVTLACDGGGAAAPVAAYPIMPGAATGGTFNADNYDISYLPGSLTVDKAGQAITFGPLAEQTYGDAPFELTATANSGLAVSYASSDPTVASVAGNTVTIHKAGDTILTASQAGDDNHHAATPVAQTLTVKPAPPTTFEAWAADPARGLTGGVNDGPLDDPDFDGFSNLLEFALGGEPMVSSQVIRPMLTQTGGNWVFSYQRSHLSKPGTTQTVEYGDALSGWLPLGIPEETAGAVTITPGVFSDLVEVVIPAQGDKRFVRLSVSQADP
jgi:autotransporter-associated beta strand protein